MAGGKFTVPVSGIWLRNIGYEVQVLAEVDGEWHLVIQENADGSYSNIVESSGIVQSPLAAVREQE